MKILNEVFKNNIPFDIHETVYFMYKNLIYCKCIVGIQIPEVLKPLKDPDLINPVVLKGSFKYYFGNPFSTADDYILKDDGMPIKIKCSDCFKTSEELIEHLEKTAV